MSPLPRIRPPDGAAEAAISRLWVSFGIRLRDARLSRKWRVEDLAQRAGVSRSIAYAAEMGKQISSESAVRLAAALGLRVELQLIDPRRRDQRPSLSADPVHSFMGEFEAAHFNALGKRVGI